MTAIFKATVINKFKVFFVSGIDVETGNRDSVVYVFFPSYSWVSMAQGINDNDNDHSNKNLGHL